MDSDSPMPVEEPKLRVAQGNSPRVHSYSAEIIQRRRSTSVSDDYAVQKTNDDAAESKYVAIKMGYYKDEFLPQFFSLPTEHVARRDPEISRGYWARVSAIRTLVDNFLRVAGPSCQIINLGAGFDTLYWRLKKDNAKFAKFIDVDFSSVTAKKIRQLLKSKELMSAISEPFTETQHADFFSDDYCLIGSDLRQNQELRAKLESTKIDFKSPTLFVCECVLVYMHMDPGSIVLKTLASWFDTAVFINYEQVNMKDAFGEVMQKNLQQRGVVLGGLVACESLESQKKRFQEADWSHVTVWTMWEIYDKILPAEERARIEKIELLDEKELLTQLLEHYCMLVAFKDSSSTSIRYEDLLF